MFVICPSVAGAVALTVTEGKGVRGQVAELANDRLLEN
jgi:hypothetical protein